jgi:hypothetical protein
MLLALFAFGGIIAFSAVFVVATQVEETVNPLLADDSSTGLADPAADTLAGHHPITPPPIGDWQLCTVASLREAEAVLDCLEQQGVAEREQVIHGNSSFAVRWR